MSGAIHRLLPYALMACHKHQIQHTNTCALHPSHRDPRQGTNAVPPAHFQVLAADSCLLGCDALLWLKCFPTFRTNLPPPPSRAQGLFLTYNETLKMKAADSFETSGSITLYCDLRYSTIFLENSQTLNGI